MAIRPVELTNREMLNLCQVVLWAHKPAVSDALREKIRAVQQQALNTVDGFYVSSLAGPKYTDGEKQLIYGAIVDQGD
jgi:hypothetical protein